MTTPTLFKEHIWLVNTIHQARNITLNDINRKWLKTEMSGGVELARSGINYNLRWQFGTLKHGNAPTYLKCGAFIVEVNPLIPG